MAFAFSEPTAFRTCPALPRVAMCASAAATFRISPSSTLVLLAENTSFLGSSYSSTMQGLGTHLGRFAYLTLEAREVLSFPSIKMQTA